jgi:hypothetical protein
MLSCPAADLPRLFDVSLGVTFCGVVWDSAVYHDAHLPLRSPTPHGRAAISIVPPAILYGLRFVCLDRRHLMAFEQQRVLACVTSDARTE